MLSVFGAGAPVLNYDKLSRSNEEANSLSKEDVIEIEGIVREAMPNAIFKVEMLSEDKNTGKLTPSEMCIRDRSRAPRAA